MLIETKLKLSNKVEMKNMDEISYVEKPDLEIEKLVVEFELRKVYITVKHFFWM